MNASAALLSVAAFVLVHALRQDEKTNGGGRNKAEDVVVDISTVPWHVALFVNGVYECGGTIISERWILSAAHCTVHRETMPLVVRVGSNDNASGGKTYPVEKVVTHPGYLTNANNDLSALKTSKPVVFSQTVAKATLPAKGATSPPAVGTKLLEVSWHRRNVTDVNLKLTTVQVKTLDFAKCEREFASFKPEEALQLCAGSSSRESCDGDTGGSLVDGKLLVGVVSYGNEFCGHNPGVFTKVTAFRDWIAETTGV